MVSSVLRFIVVSPTVIEGQDLNENKHGHNCRHIVTTTAIPLPLLLNHSPPQEAKKEARNEYV